MVVRGERRRCQLICTTNSAVSYNPRRQSKGDTLLRWRDPTRTKEVNPNDDEKRNLQLLFLPRLDLHLWLPNPRAIGPMLFG